MTVTWLGTITVGILVLFGWMGYRRGFIKEVVSMFFVVLSIALVWLINPYVNDFLRNQTPLYGTVQSGCQDFVMAQMDDYVTIGERKQQDMIEKLGLPDFLTDGLKENNNASVYRYLDVTSFVDYVADYLAVAFVNGISFLVSFVLATLLIRMITYALNIIARLPVIHGINRITGGVVGVLKGLLFIWVFLLIMTVLCNTDIGRQILALVEKDDILKFFYEKDIFIKIFMSIFYGNA